MSQFCLEWASDSFDLSASSRVTGASRATTQRSRSIGCRVRRSENKTLLLGRIARRRTPCSPPA
eukprot:3398024-Pyramimonas_sp.AAC.1